MSEPTALDYWRGAKIFSLIMAIAFTCGAGVFWYLFVDCWRWKP